MSNSDQSSFSFSQSDQDEVKKTTNPASEPDAHKPKEENLALPASEPWIRPEEEEYFLYEI
jgi:hypothetical protein